MDIWLHKKIGCFLMLLFIVAVLLLSGCIEKRESIMVNEIERTFILHVPESYDETTPTPLVVVLHGGGGNAENIESVSGFSQKADEEGFLVVYPDGTGRFNYKLLTWNGGFCCGYALENNIDDVYFIETLIDHLKNQYTINESRIYATGLSNGAVMTYRLGAELSDVFAAIAPIAGSVGGQATINDSVWKIPEPVEPVSVMCFHGTNDTRVPYDGGRPLDDDVHVYSWLSVNESIAFWINQNNCSKNANRFISDSGNIITDSYTKGNKETEVVLVSIVNGTHSWPGGEKGYRKGDMPTKEIDATDMMWDFFMKHPKQ